MLQYLANGAAFDAISERDVLLSRPGIFLMIFTYGFAIDIEKALLSLLLAGNNGGLDVREGIGSQCLGDGGGSGGDGGHFGRDTKCGRGGTRI